MQTTQRAVLESLAAQGEPEAIHELMTLPDLPSLGAHLWTWFSELNATRTSTGMGAGRITRAEIHAWEADEGHRLELWERRALIAIDAAWMKSASAPKTGGGRAND